MRTTGDILFSVNGMMVFAANAVVAVQPMLVHMDVFQAGKEGYHIYLIPSVTTAPDDTLSVFAEGRRDNRENPGGGDIDLVYKRSTDNVASWSSRQILDNPGEGWASSNPTVVLGRRLDRVWVLYNRWEPGYGTRTSQLGTTNNQSWERYSGDRSVSLGTLGCSLSTESQGTQSWLCRRLECTDG